MPANPEHRPSSQDTKPEKSAEEPVEGGKTIYVAPKGEQLSNNRHIDGTAKATPDSRLTRQARTAGVFRTGKPPRPARG